MTNPLEIERKFLINEDFLPDINQYPQKQIMQGYISFEHEVRIRAVKQDGKTTYYTTKKGAGTLAREEDEIEITPEDFNHKLKRIDKKFLIRKTRYEIPIDNGLTAELDVFHNPQFKDYAGPNTGAHKTAEVEFSSHEAAQHFNIPNWFGKEVTNDKSFKNISLAKALIEKQR